MVWQIGARASGQAREHGESRYLRYDGLGGTPNRKKKHLAR